MHTWIVAAFADRPFKGNPAGVCLVDQNLDAAQMADIAAALNQPETAFVAREGDDWRVRWFSPRVEVALCGHATLAAAHVLWSELGVARDPLTFHYAGGLLGARRDGASIVLDFPAIIGAMETPSIDLLACVERAPIRSARHADRWIFEYATARDVRDLKPDFARLAATGVRSLIVTARSDDRDYDIVSRNFAPIVGVNEDQVTGAAHCCLGPYWLERLGPDLRCWQASRRGGALRVRTRGDRVELGGQAAIEFAGTLRL